MGKDILIIPGSGSIQFSGSDDTYTELFTGDSSTLHFSGSKFVVSGSLQSSGSQTGQSQIDLGLIVNNSQSGSADSDFIVNSDSGLAFKISASEDKAYFEVPVYVDSDISASGNIYISNDLEVTSITASGDIVIDGLVDGVDIYEFSQSVSNSLDTLFIASESFSNDIDNLEITASELVPDFGAIQSVITSSDVEFNTVTASRGLYVSESVFVEGYLTVTASDDPTYFMNTNVGIGTETPSVELEVSGSISASGDININESSSYLYGGSIAFRLSKNGQSDYYSTLIGDESGNYADLDSIRQTSVGYHSGKDNHGSYQTALGAFAGEGNAGDSQVAIGDNSGYMNNGDSQIAIGVDAGYKNTGSGNVSIGYASGYMNNGDSQIAIGFSAGYENTGSDNVSIGYFSGYKNSGSDNIFIGREAGKNNDLSNQFIIHQKNINEYPLIQGDFDTGNVGIGIATPSKKLTISGSVSASGDLFIEGDATLYEDVNSEEYAGGFSGYGWKINPNYGQHVGGSDSGSGTLLEVDHLSVRGTMNIYELLINQIRATNGNLFVSAVGKVSSSVPTLNPYEWTLYFDDSEGAGHGFAEGDLIRAQRVNMASLTGSNPSNGMLVYRSDLIVKNVASTGELTATASSDITTAPSGGFEYVRLGNTGSYENRQGSIYLTADDIYAPFVDVIDGVDSFENFNNSESVKLRMGKLDGINDMTNFAIPENTYGFWASGSAYLEGSINADNGYIGGWEIGNTFLSSSNGKIILNNTDEYISLGNLNNSMDPNEISGDGVFMSGSGQIRIGGENEYIIWDGDSLYLKSDNVILTASGIEITTDLFTLSSSTILIGSNNGGSISLGENANQSEFNINNYNGITLSGSGDVGIGNSSGAHISFVNGELEISSSNFFVGNENAQFISGSGSEIEISSSNFWLQPNGNVSISGDINATSGNVSSSIAQLILDSSSFNISIGELSNFSESLSGSNIVTFINADEEGVQIQGNHLEFSGSTFWLGNDEQFISGSDGVIEIRSDNFWLQNNGDVFISGSVTASTLLVGSENGEYLSYSDGNFYLSMSNFSASGDNIYISSSNFLLENGNIDLSGSITASAFLMGNRDSDYISFDGDDLVIEIQNLSASGDNVYISSSNFLLEDGNIIANNVSLTGSIFALEGDIAGWTIDTNSINNNNVYLSSESSSLLVLNNNNDEVIRIGSGSEFDVNIEGENKLNSGSFEGLSWEDNFAWGVDCSPYLTYERVDGGFGPSVPNYCLKISGSGDQTLTDGTVNFQVTQSFMWDDDLDTNSSINLTFDSKRIEQVDSRVVSSEYKYEIYGSNDTSNYTLLISGSFYPSFNEWSTKNIIIGSIGDDSKKGIKLIITYTANTYGTNIPVKFFENLYLDNFNIYRFNNFTKLTQEGLLIYDTPYQHLISNKDGIKIKGGNIEGQDITSQNSLTVNGNANILGVLSASVMSDLNINGSIVVSDGIITSGSIFTHADITASGDIVASGDVIAQWDGSDIRLKENLSPISNSLKSISQLTGYTFDWNYPGKEHIYNGHDVGLIAQDVQKILPEAVGMRNDGYLSLSYERIIPLLINGIKEQQVKINELNERLLKLEESLNNE